ncbi:MAG: hypothetical protein WDW38_000277 [Sanguina aurantia]
MTSVTAQHDFPSRLWIRCLSTSPTPLQPDCSQRWASSAAAVSGADAAATSLPVKVLGECQSSEDPAAVPAAASAAAADFGKPSFPAFSAGLVATSPQLPRHELRPGWDAYRAADFLAHQGPKLTASPNKAAANQSATIHSTSTSQPHTLPPSSHSPERAPAQASASTTVSPVVDSQHLASTPAESVSSATSVPAAAAPDTDAAGAEGAAASARPAVGTGSTRADAVCAQLTTASQETAAAAARPAAAAAPSVATAVPAPAAARAAAATLTATATSNIAWVKRPKKGKGKAKAEAPNTAADVFLMLKAQKLHPPPSPMAGSLFFPVEQLYALLLSWGSGASSGHGIPPPNHAPHVTPAAPGASSPSIIPAAPASDVWSLASQDRSPDAALPALTSPPILTADSDGVCTPQGSQLLIDMPSMDVPQPQPTPESTAAGKKARKQAAAGATAPPFKPLEEASSLTSMVSSPPDSTSVVGISAAAQPSCESGSSTASVPATERASVLGAWTVVGGAAVVSAPPRSEPQARDDGQFMATYDALYAEATDTGDTPTPGGEVGVEGAVLMQDRPSTSVTVLAAAAVAALAKAEALVVAANLAEAAAAAAAAKKAAAVEKMALLYERATVVKAAGVRVLAAAAANPKAARDVEVAAAKAANEKAANVAKVVTAAHAAALVKADHVLKGVATAQAAAVEARSAADLAVAQAEFPNDNNQDQISSGGELVAEGRRFDLCQLTVLGVEKWGQKLLGKADWSKPGAPKSWKLSSG